MGFEKRCQRCNWELEYGETDRGVFMESIVARLCLECKVALGVFVNALPETQESAEIGVRAKIAYQLVRFDGKDRAAEIIELTKKSDDCYRRATAKAKEWIETKVPQAAQPEPIKPRPMCAPEASAKPGLEAQ